ncbi:uncharacterized protein LOC116420390 isoform X2 [Sarcophilus harrisii]|uniref:uncharacterized protein LOC116420390 isoform X2 n=1 Tax=Sarcophilus harrisii TaxID=9305 RepID=UPI001301CD9A|nr:uncharacterized protein LOC116420390 isoform X2 [Sarcophilus harrisii]XP_031801091.1 uncharacterized protein LOC116420390 isoform X2 [Sarcophilus harrisii]
MRWRSSAAQQGVLFQRQLQDIMDSHIFYAVDSYSEWNSSLYLLLLDFVESALAAFICTAGGLPPKTSPGHGLPQTNSLENLGNLQDNRYFAIVKEADTWLEERGGAVAAFICTAGGLLPNTAPGHVPGASELKVLPAYVSSGFPRNNPLKQLGKLQQNSRGCSGGLHLHSRGSFPNNSSMIWFCSQSSWPSTAQNGILLM